MKVDDNLQVGLPCPSDRLVKVVRRTHDVWIFTIFLECPIADRNAHSVEASTCDLLKITQSYPTAPM